MAKSQKEKSMTKDRLIGMTVINSEGNVIGTVKDLGFTVGKTGISLSVEEKNGDVKDVPWDNIQGAGEFVVLKPVGQVAQSAAQTTQCTTCGGPLTYVQQYQRWYCYKCQKYA